MKMDMIIRNAFVYNSFTQSFAKKDVAVKDGQFVWIHDHIEEDNGRNLRQSNLKKLGYPAGPVNVCRFIQIHGNIF